MGMLDGVRVIKDERLTILAQPLTIGEKSLLSLKILAGLDLEHPSDLMDESEFWGAGVAALGKDLGLDYGFPKPHGEFLVAGKCFADNGRPTPMGRVEVRIGSLTKDLVVFGNRRWRKLGPLGFGMTDPEPFSEMPVIWNKAFGGPDYPQNPLGVGILHKKSTTGHLGLDLPNIEDPRNLIADPDDRPPPAGLYPRGLSWRESFGQLGTFDDDWLKRFWPGLPPDIDPRFFNRAPVDQWLDGFFRGDESIRILHMHPRKPFLESRLPGLCARCLASWESGQGQADVEITTRLETVWLFPHLDCGVLIWAGAVDTDQFEDSRLAALTAAVEPLDAPPVPADRIIGLFMISPDEETEEEEALPEAEKRVIEEPAGPPPPDPSIQATLEEANDRVSQARAELAARLSRLGIRMPEDAFSDPVMVGGGEAFSDPEALDRMVAGLESGLKDSLTRLGLDFDAPAPVIEERPERSMAEILEAWQAVGLKDPEFLESMKVMMGEADEARAAMEGVHGGPEEPRIEIEDEPLPEAAETPMTREAVLAAYQSGDTFSGLDLTGIDLSNAFLVGADFSDCFLERANLARTDLSEANLRGAVLTEADLTGGRFRSADLTRVSAARVKAVETDFSDARMPESDWDQTDFSKAVLARADLSRADLTRARLFRVKAMDCQAPQANLAEAEAEGADFSNSDLSETDWSGARLDQGRLATVNLRGARLSEVRGEKLVLTGADLTGVKVDGPASMPEADFTEADLSQAYWQEADLSGASFLKATLTSAGLVRCNLSRADFRCCRAREAMFLGSNFERAACSDADFHTASWRETILYETDLRRSNLYWADLTGVRYRNTLVEGAILTRTLLLNPVLGKVRK